MSGAKIDQRIRHQATQDKARFDQLQSDLDAAQLELNQVKNTVDQVAANQPTPVVPAP